MNNTFRALMKLTDGGYFSQIQGLNPRCRRIVKGARKIWARIDAGPMKGAEINVFGFILNGTILFWGHDGRQQTIQARDITLLLEEKLLAVMEGAAKSVEIKKPPKAEVKKAKPKVAPKLPRVKIVEVKEAVTKPKQPPPKEPLRILLLPLREGSPRTTPEQMSLPEAFRGCHVITHKMTG